MMDNYPANRFLAKRATNAGDILGNRVRERAIQYPLRKKFSPNDSYTDSRMESSSSEATENALLE